MSCLGWWQCSPSHWVGELVRYQGGPWRGAWGTSGCGPTLSSICMKGCQGDQVPGGSKGESPAHAGPDASRGNACPSFWPPAEPLWVMPTFTRGAPRAPQPHLAWVRGHPALPGFQVAGGRAGVYTATDLSGLPTGLIEKQSFKYFT